ncbi:MAG: hypothetical protein PHQ58_04535 [Rhodoferax sp.]|uniref:DUF7941 domain-family protein n=1 Tax=Rhodoferax sp. TaxID=50421 RepID=UPI002627F3D1|nr:hypothetical protein [Rhodoferax sp.]MDD2879683.1 hypothetical protein [Rhodoferax sp.]
MATNPVKRNYDKPTKELALEQIALATKYRIPSNKIMFGKPKEMDIVPGDANDENTFVSARVADGYPADENRTVNFFYHREDISVLYPADPLPIEPAAYPFNLYDVLPQINVLLGAQLGKDDVINDTFYNDNITLRAAASSLMWIGSKTFNIGNVEKKLLLDNNTTIGFLQYVNP